MADLERSYVLCSTIARRAARNFYYAFLLLPRPQRRSMCALYAFLRETDDLSDNEQPVEVRRAALVRWRNSLDRALAGQFDSPILPALADTIARYEVAPSDLHAVIDGVEMDLAQSTYETFDDLRVYCQRVASAVGLACLSIWNCRDTAARQPAIDCGIAFQLTNILRDLEEDLNRGRVYLPQEDLRKFGCDLAVLRLGTRDPRFRALMHDQIRRAQRYYESAAALAPYLDPAAQRVFWTMMGTYRALLEEIERRDGDVLSTRVRLTAWHKWRIAAQSLLNHSRTGSWLRGLTRG